MAFDKGLFSERELEVVRLLLQGKSNKQMALELDVTSRTVEFHLGKIYRKLGVASRAEAILRLTGSQLRETEKDLISAKQRESTVEVNSDPSENGVKNIFQRINMKKTVYFIAGAALLVVLALYLPKPSGVDVNPTSTSQPTIAGVNTTPTTLPLPAGEAIVPDVAIQSHTVNGITAAIESYYADTSHLIFQVRIIGGDVTFGDPNYYGRFGSLDLYDENGNLVNTSGGFGSAVDPELVQIELTPLTLFTADRLKGQLSFEVNAAPAYDQILANFHFDFDMAIQPIKTYQPKQVISANGMDILLDTIMVSPTFTNVYLCFQPPSFADWNISSKSTLEVNGAQSTPLISRLLFDSAIGGDRRAGSEPYWAPPVKEGRCVKNTFPVGDIEPRSIELQIPYLEQNSPDVLLTNMLSTNYPGLPIKQAYQTYLEETGAIYKGPWVFITDFKP